MSKKLNPWKIPTLNPETYQQLKKFYSLEDVNFELKNNPNFVKRNLLIGHDRFKDWLKKAENGEKVALVSGFMTSGFLHLGSLAVIKQMVYYQKEYNATAIIPIADLEAMCVRKIKKSEIKKILTEFLAHFFAAGLSPEKTIIYLQSKNTQILREAGLYTSKVDMSDLEKIYDRRLSLGEAYSSLVMAADILCPQKNGYKSTLITLGIDEISHFILVKELINLLGKEFHSPSITYNKILTGLNGSKMGKSLPQNSILLSDSPKIAKAKLNELKKKDFELFENTAFNILEWYLEDDSIINKILETSNKKEANNLAIEESCKLLDKLLTEHNKKYKQNLKRAKKFSNKLIEND